MGCGATICGAPSSSPTQAQLLLKSSQLLRMLVPKIKPNQYLLSKSTVDKFIQELQMNGQVYVLKGWGLIQKGEEVPVRIMEKWRVILYGLDGEFQQYVNCLGYKECVKRVDGDCKGDVELPEQLPHPCFQQIGKDLDRTFQLPELKRQSFSKILKCIARHFPKMGYTQGVNFIVGYLLIVGFSQRDAFWLFAHIALNRRYMLLGLFEDGFPLSKVYITIFKNILKRRSPALFTHLYQSIILNDSLWIFKWFITYYLYSFPIEMCKYVWDLVIGQGGIGLVNFAIGITTCLQGTLMTLNDQCEVSEFFGQLKELDGFNCYVKIEEVMRIAYGVRMEMADLEGVQLQDSGVYAKYFVQYWAMQISNAEDKNQDMVVGISSRQISEGNLLGAEDLQKFNEKTKPKFSNNRTQTTEFLPSKVPTISYSSTSPPLKVVQLPTKSSYNNTRNEKSRRFSIDFQKDKCTILLLEWYGSLYREREQFVKMRGLSHYKSNRISINRQIKLLGKGQQQSLVRIGGIDEVDEKKGIKLMQKVSMEDSLDSFIAGSNQKMQRLSLQSQQGQFHQPYKQKQKQKTGTLTYRSSNRYPPKRQHISNKIHEIWDEQQDMINQSRDQIGDIEIIRAIPGIPKMKIDLDEQFGEIHELEDVYIKNDQKQKVSYCGVRKRSGSKMSQKRVEEKSRQGQYVSKSTVKTGGVRQEVVSSRNKVKTEEEKFPVMRKQTNNQNNVYQCDSLTSMPLPVSIPVPYKATSAAFGKAVPMKYVGAGGYGNSNSVKGDYQNQNFHLGPNNQGSDTSSQNNHRNSRLAMAGKNIMSSMSISNASASGISSTSSQKNHQNSGSNNNPNIRDNGFSDPYREYNQSQYQNNYSNGNGNGESNSRKWKESEVNININVNFNVNVNNYGTGNGSRDCNCDRGHGYTNHQYNHAKGHQSNNQNVQQDQLSQSNNSRRQSNQSYGKSSLDLEPVQNGGIRQRSSAYNTKMTPQYLLSTNPNHLANSSNLMENGNQKKRVNTFKGWDINSNSQGPDVSYMVNSISKHSVGSEVEIYDGGQLFKKKNRVANRIGGGVGVIAPPSKGFEDYQGNIRFKKDNRPKYPITQPINKQNPNIMLSPSPQKFYQNTNNIINANEVSQFLNLNINKLEHQESCESIFLPGNSQGHQGSIFSEGRSRATGNNQGFEIESVK